MAALAVARRHLFRRGTTSPQPTNELTAKVIMTIDVLRPVRLVWAALHLRRSETGRTQDNSQSTDSWLVNRVPNLPRCSHRRQFALAETRSGCINRRQFGQSLTRTLPSRSDRFWGKCAGNRRICSGVNTDARGKTGVLWAGCPTAASCRSRQLRAVLSTQCMSGGALKPATNRRVSIGLLPEH